MTINGNQIPRQLTKKEAAELLQVHPKTITRWIAAGKLPAWRYAGGSTIRIDEADLLNLRQPVNVETTQPQEEGQE